MSTRPQLSWLILERYALGELSAQAEEAVQRALADDQRARGWLAEIEGDARPLPALPATAPKTRRRSWLLWLAPALAATAAAMMLWMILPQFGIPSDPPAASVAYKGGEITIGLVRLRGKDTSFAPKDFAPGDRFQARISCPPGHGKKLEFYVVQEDKRSWPLGRTLPRFTCGNQVVLDGAFTIDGKTPARVCAEINGEATVCRRLVHRGR